MVNVLVDSDKRTALIKFDQYNWDFIVKESELGGQSLQEVIAVIFIEGRIEVGGKG